MTTFDKIEKTLAAMTPAPWFHYGDGVLRGAHTNAEDEKKNLEGVVLLRNLAPAMLKVVKAADAVDDCVFPGDGDLGGKLMPDGMDALKDAIAALKAAVDGKP